MSDRRLVRLVDSTDSEWVNPDLVVSITDNKTQSLYPETWVSFVGGGGASYYLAPDVVARALGYRLEDASDE